MLLDLLYENLARRELFWCSYGIFVGLNILDGHSTWLVLKPDHFRRERNPVARWIFRKLSIPLGIIIFKAALLAVLSLAFWFYAAEDLFTLNIVLAVADLVFLVVVLHNYRVHRRLRKF